MQVFNDPINNASCRKKIPPPLGTAIQILPVLFFSPRVFRNMDDNRSWTLDREEFKKGLGDFGITFKDDVSCCFFCRDLEIHYCMDSYHFLSWLMEYFHMIMFALSVKVRGET